MSDIDALKKKKTIWIVILSLLVGLPILFGAVVTLMIGIGNRNTVKMQELLIAEDSVWEDSTQRFTLTFSQEAKYALLEEAESEQAIRMHFGAPGRVIFSEFDKNRPDDYPDESEEWVAYAGWYYDKETDVFTLDDMPSFEDNFPMNMEGLNTLLFNRTYG